MELSAPQQRSVQAAFLNLLPFLRDIDGAADGDAAAAADDSDDNGHFIFQC